jgi:hypothetical protein
MQVFWLYKYYVGFYKTLKLSIFVIATQFLDVIHLLSYLKTPSCLFFKIQRFGDWILSLFIQVKPTQLGPIDTASPYLRNVIFK